MSPPTALARARASVVLPTPGTASIRTWPRASMAIRQSSTAAGLPSSAPSTARRSSPSRSIRWASIATTVEVIPCIVAWGPAASGASRRASFRFCRGGAEGETRVPGWAAGPGGGGASGARGPGGVMHGDGGGDRADRGARRDAAFRLHGGAPRRERRLRARDDLGARGTERRGKEHALGG